MPACSRVGLFLARGPFPVAPVLALLVTFPFAGGGTREA